MVAAIPSLCRLCSNPETCALCEIVRRPRPLTSREIARLGLTSHPAAVQAIADARIVELQRQIEAERALNLRLRARLADRQVAPVPRPTPTAPMSAPPMKAPAPAPLPPPVTTFGALVRGDWAGLQARVDAGALTEEQARAIGTQWLGEVKTHARA